MIFVVDSSVVVKWFAREDDADLALGLRSRSRSLASPDFLIVECANVLWKKARRKEITEADALLALSVLETFDFRVWPSTTLAARAFQLARRLDHSACDCFYLALAELLQSPFITAEGRLIDKVSAIGEIPTARLVRLSDVAGLLGESP